MNKGVKTLIAVIISVWIFFMGYEIGAFRETKKASSTTTTTAYQTTAATAPSTATPATVPSSAVQVDATTASPDTTAPASDTTAPAMSSDLAVESSNEKLLADVTAAINSVKTNVGTFTASCKQVKQLGITDCSMESLTNTIDNIVQKFVGGGKDETYNFAGGTGTDSSGETITPMDAIPPRKAMFALTEPGVSSITSTQNGTDTVYTVSLIAEKATLDTLPAYNSVSSGFLDLSSLSILSSIDYDYPGTVIDATVSSDGKLTALHVYMPISAKGQGKVLGYSGYASFSGSLDETWSFIYS